MSEKTLKNPKHISKTIKCQSWVLRKENSRITLSIPKHKELKPGLLRHLIKNAELSVEEFEDLL